MEVNKSQILENTGNKEESICDLVGNSRGSMASECNKGGKSISMALRF
jgi:hypothetical protein